MAFRGDQRQHLMRLQIPPPGIIQDGGQPMFSPALPTALQHSFRPSISAQFPLLPPNHQGPPHFFAPPPHIGHRGSIAGPSFPGNPLPPPMMGMPVQGPIPGAGGPPLGMAPSNHMPMHPARSGSISLPFNRTRRQPSISTGGPPKATLGGPTNKHVAAPIVNPASSVATLEAKIKGKRIVVKVPNEASGPEDQNPDQVSRSKWRRMPIPTSELAVQAEPEQPASSSCEIFPEELPRGVLPSSVEVFLPGKSGWDDVRFAAVEEKLERLGLGVESLPNRALNGVHGRAASISSPADPALLAFKLNKLHQNQSGPGSLSVSPQPPTLSPSPNLNPRYPLGRHGHSLSLANPGVSSPGYNPIGAFNPFGPNATLGSDAVQRRPSVAEGAQEDGIFAPRGVVAGRPGALLTRPDFIRGFGLDITEETEEELEEEEDASEVEGPGTAPGELGTEAENDEEVQQAESDPGSRTTPAIRSRRHSRHTSRVSVALSLRSLGRGNQSDGNIVEEDEKLGDETARPWGSEGGAHSPRDEREAIAEWTGSEISNREALDDGDDEASVGEYSNPSDEERAREARRLRRLSKEAKRLDEVPRRIPNFPRPPESIQRIQQQLMDDDIVSNPSEEEHIHHRRSAQISASHLQFLDRTPKDSPSPFGGSGSGRPLPPIPTHSRTASGQPSAYMSPHLVPLPHSRNQSGHVHTLSGNGISTPPTAGTRRESLNPNAKPFVFGKPWQPAAAPTTQTAQITAPGPKLNAAAPEFKPSSTIFSFRPPPGGPQLSFSDATTLAVHGVPSPRVKASALGDPPQDEIGRPHRGRDKRQRIDGDSSLDLSYDLKGLIITEEAPVGADGETWSNLSAFQFPQGENEAKSTQETSQQTRPSHSHLNVAAKPFVFPAPKPPAAQSALVAPSAPEAPSPLARVDELPEIAQPQGTPKPLETLAVVTAPPSRMRSPKPAPLTELPLRTASEPSTEANASRALPHRAATLMGDFHPHPPSTNTVPASLFKNLVTADGDGPTRPSVRSRLGSREAFEQGRKQSLDDIHMPAISRKVSKPKLVVEEAPAEPVSEPRLLELPASDADLFAPLSREISRDLQKSPLRLPRSALPSPTHSRAQSRSSGFSSPSPMRHHVPYDQMEDRVDEMIQERVDAAGKDLRDIVEAELSAMVNLFARSADVHIARVADEFRRDLNRMDAMGEHDIELIRNIVEDGNREVQASVQRDLVTLIQKLEVSGPSGGVPREDLSRLLSEHNARILNAIHSATMNVINRVDAVDHIVRTPKEISDLSKKVAEELLPLLQTPKTPSLNVELITAKLSDAVRPSLSQLIDFASDKKETASIIVNELAPVFASLQPQQFDTQEISAQLAADISHHVPQIDSHALTEQVADLVVERLDSRMAVRDKSLRPEVLTSHVVQSLSSSLEPLPSIVTNLQRIEAQQVDVLENQNQTAITQSAVSEQLRKLPETIKAIEAHISTAILATQTANASKDEPRAFNEILEGLQTQATAQNTLGDQIRDALEKLQLLATKVEELPAAYTSTSEPITRGQANLQELVQQTQNMLDSSLSDILHGQGTLLSQIHGVSDNQDSLLKEIKTIPDLVSASTKELETGQAALLFKLQSLPEILDLQQAKLDLQSTLQRARNDHGKVRIEKEVLQERLKNVENERDRLRVEIHNVKSSAAEQETEVVSSKAEVEQVKLSLSDALARIQTSEAVNRELREQMNALQASQRELQRTANDRQAKIHSLELQSQFAKRDAEQSKEAYLRLEKERDAALDSHQQGSLEVQLMSQKLEALMTMLTSKESDELRALRREKERALVMEAELTAAKKRIADLESKAESAHRLEATTSQRLVSVQQHADEADSKVKRLEQQVEELKRIEEASLARNSEIDQIKSQLEAQSKQENEMRQINQTLEEEVSTLRADLERLQRAQATARWQQETAKASEVAPNPSATPRVKPVTLNGRASPDPSNSRSNTPPAVKPAPTTNGVWASRHAPKNGVTPKTPIRQPQQSFKPQNHYKPAPAPVYNRPPSPAQSVVSQVPTLRDDGWWE